MAGLHDRFGEDDPVCLDFDLCCELRLQIEQQEAMETQAKLIAIEMAKLRLGDDV